MIRKIIFICSVLSINYSCVSKTSELPNFDEVLKLEIVNKGFNKTSIKKNITITDSLIINSLKSIIENFEIIERDYTIGPNEGYILSTFFLKDNKKITIKNFYSIDNGVIILVEDDIGIRRYRSNEYSVRIEKLMGNSTD